MKWHSSIFSSDTLFIDFRIPAGAIFALVLVLIANVWAYNAEKNGMLYSSIPRQMIENSITKLTQNAGSWWLGNSTLAAGLNKEMINEKTESGNAIVELGSATLDTTIRLSEIALERTEVKPKNIFLFFTKDDINSSGARADASSAYHQAIESPSLYERVASLFPVYSTRYAITDKLRTGIATITMGKKAEAASAETSGNEKKTSYRDLSGEVDTTYLLNLGRDYRPIDIDFSRLGMLAKKYGTRVYLVSPPVTSAISDWQRRYAPEYTWDVLLGDISTDATKAGITVLDYTAMLDSTTEFFKDTYHLNRNGSRIFTKRILHDVFNYNI